MICSSIVCSQCPLDIGETASAPSDNLLLYFPFEGDANNLGNPTYSASVNGANYVESSCGKGLDFDGEDDYVLVTPSLYLDDDYTVTAWVNARSFDDAMGIFSIRDQCNISYRGFSISQFNIGDYNLQTLNNQVNKHGDCVGYSNGDRYTNDNIILPQSEDIFVGLTVENNSSEDRVVRLFVNCEEYITEMVIDFSTGACFDPQIDYLTTIGASSSVSGHESSFDGIVDELRVYERVLSHSELLDVYRDCNPIEIEVTRFTDCESDSAVVALNNTQLEVEYQLYDVTNDTVAGSPKQGNCGTLLFFTNRVDTLTRYEIIATNINNGCSIRLDSVITISPVASMNPVSAGSDRVLSFCLDSGVINLSSYLQDADAGGQWSPRSEIELLPENGRVYTYTVEDSCGSDSAFFEIFIWPELNVSLEGPDQFCDGGQGVISLAGDLNPINGIEWNTGSTDSFILVDQAGWYTVEIEYGADCQWKDSIYVEVNEDLVFLDSIILCEGDTLIWRGQTITEGGRYDERSLGDSNCDSLFIVEVTIEDMPRIVEEIALCEGELRELYGREFDSIGEFQFILPSVISCDTQVTLIVVPRDTILVEVEQVVCEGERFDFRGEEWDVGGPYRIVTEVEGGCDTIWQLWINEEQYESIRILGPNRLCESDTELDVVGVSAGELIESRWNTGDLGLSLNISTPGLYRWTGESFNGCKYIAEWEVEECSDCKIAIPNVFSPNGDGVNDVFDLSSSCEWADFRAQIFDRWGNKLVESRDPKAIWDGLNHSPDVYVYRISYKYETDRGLIEKVEHGTVTLVR